MPSDQSRRRKTWAWEVGAVPVIVALCVLLAGAPLWGAVGFGFLTQVVTLFSVGIMDAVR